MADRSGLKFVGFIFATVTMAVMLTTGMVVKGYADGVYSLDERADRQGSLTIAAESPSAKFSPAPGQRQYHHRDRQQTDKPDHDGPHSGRRTPQRNWVGLVRLDAVHEDVPENWQT